MSEKKRLIPAFLAAILLASGFLFLKTLREGGEGLEIYENLQEEVQVADASGAFPDISLDVERLLAENGDFTAWIYYADGKLNHPIVQESYEEINKYLTTSFDGLTSCAGCLFLPFDATEDFTAYNSFIHGHNMRGGSMFGSLKTLYQKPENNEFPWFFIWTKDHERMMYRVIAMYVTDENSAMTAAAMEETEQKEYIQEALKLGSTDGQLEFTDEEWDAALGGARLVTLSTCYGASGSDQRLLVHGIEILRESWE
ncbi:MAG: class B sortase [Lachnospiraceae bacterium]|nr:class B sortase [Lachnospiraceae bacterium]